VNAHYILLAHLLKSLVAERFKRMAKDEVLFKFLSNKVDPAILVDYHLQSEKEALDLAEMSLLELVDSERMNAELQKSAERIQMNFHNIFKTDGSENFKSPSLVDHRMHWLRGRIHFFRKWLSFSESSNSPLDLALRAFQNAKAFRSNLEVLQRTDLDCADETVKATTQLHRFLMKKHLDHELKNSHDLWLEFADQAFRKTPELAD
jgi:hypothetical protein